MIETCFASRYTPDKTKPWGKVIQLKRTILKWDYENGMTMGGTWDGIIPEDGVYLFQNRTKVMFAGENTQALNVKNGVFPMICTFAGNGSWQASDYFYKNQQAGCWSGSVDSRNESISFYANQTFGPNSPLKYWFSGSQAVTFEPSLGDKLQMDESATGLTQENTLAVRNSRHGYVASFGGKFFSGRDVLAGSPGTPVARLLNPNSVNIESIKRVGVMDNVVMAVSKLKDDVGDKSHYGAIGRFVDSPGQTHYGNTIEVVANRRNLKTPFTTLGTLEGIPYMEGKTGTYEDGLGGELPPITELTINQAINPKQGFRGTYSTTAFVGDGMCVKEVDFYEQKTTLMGVTISNT